VRKFSGQRSVVGDQRTVISDRVGEYLKSFSISNIERRTSSSTVSLYKVDYLLEHTKVDSQAHGLLGFAYLQASANSLCQIGSGHIIISFIHPKLGGYALAT
jgi:hypothetical protein